MSEILEKSLLIAFGLITFIIFYPYIIPYINLIPNDSESTDEIITKDLKNLDKNIKKSEDQRDSINNTYKFLFKGNISLTIDGYYESDIVLIFRFKLNDYIKYEKFQLSNIFNITIGTLYIKSYKIGYQNNSHFIYFF